MPVGKKADTWDLLNMMQNPAEDTKKIASLGQQALAMGIVSPEDAMQEIRNIGRDVSPILKHLQIGADPKAQMLAMNSDEATALMNQRRAEAQGQAVGAPSVPSATPGVFSKIQVPNLPEPSVKSVPKGSGLQASDEATGKAGGRTNVQRMLTMSPDEWQSSYESAMQTPAIQEQMKGIHDIRDLLTMEAQAPSQLNLAPLAALTDSMTGSRLLAGYAPPQDRQKRLADYMLKIQDDRKDLAKTIIDAIGKQKAGTMQEMLYQDFINKRAAEAQDPSMKAGGKPTMPLDARAIRDVQGKFNKSIEPFSKSLNFSKEVESLIGNAGPGSKLTKKTVETILARARGEVGNLSYYEQAGTAAPQDVLSRLTQSLETLTTGELTPETKTEILGLVNQYKGAAKEAINSYRDVHAKQGAEAYGSIGLGESRFKKALPGVDAGVSVKPTQTKAYDGSTALPADATQAMKDARREYLKKKAGGK